MLEALLFDMDGTLVDSDPTHFVAWQEMLERHGLSIDQEQYKNEMSGRENPHIVKDFFPDWDPEKVAAFIEAKEQRFRELADGLEPTPGLLELVDWAELNGVKCALVTNAIRENMTFVLDALELRDRFEVALSVDDVQSGKPDPEIYTRALEGLGVSPEHALAFEDSASGVRSARAAGLKVIGVTSGLSAERLRELGAADAIEDFFDLILKLYIDV